MTRKRQLKQAQHTRSQIARVFVSLRDERTTLAELLRDVPTCLGRVSVHNVLRRAPRLGHDGASKVCQKAKVWPVARLGNLTPEERERLIAHLPPRAKD